jgi:hypothetical protein
MLKILYRCYLCVFELWRAAIDNHSESGTWTTTIQYYIKYCGTWAATINYAG